MGSYKESDQSFKDYILDQLNGLPNVRCKAMFGGFGLYLNEDFFGIIHQGILYFKTGKDTRKTYIDKGMGPFKPSQKQTLKNYYQVPTEILEDQDSIQEWALKAVSQ